MSVFVDDLFVWPPTGKQWCRMIADTDEEMEEFARLLGLKRQWKHGDHYDLTPSKRNEALRRGAIPVTTNYFIQIRRRNQEE